MAEEEESTLEESWEKVCKERTENITNQIKASTELLGGKISQVDEKIETLIQNHADILERHEEEIKDGREAVGEINVQMGAILQWKANGEEKKAAWYRHQGFVITVAVFIVGILSNINKITAAVKGMLTVVGGGKP